MKIRSITRKHYDKPIQLYDIVNTGPNHNFEIVGEDHNYVVHNCAVMDEINFSRAGVKDISKAKSTMLDTYNTISTRIKGTFRQDGEVVGKLFAVSSKKSDSDFLEDHLERQRKSGADKHMYVSDAPQWEVLPASNYSKGIFFIAVGNRHQKGYVIPENDCTPEGLEDVKKQGFKIMTPPIDYKPEFIADFEIALRDIAGISVPGTLSFITQELLTSCLSTTRRNPFYNDILTIGTKDTLSIEEFFHLECVTKDIKAKPLFIHLDLSLNTDKTGIGGVFANGRHMMQTENGESISQLKMGHLFSVSIQAPSGDKIPYGKITEFICWLRKQGFNIQGISRDQYQSEYMAQLLEAQGFKVDKLSLDRTPDGYVALRSAMQEHRFELLDVEILQDELIHLQRDAISGKIDHPAGGCFRGDVKIRLFNNTSISFEDLFLEYRSGIRKSRFVSSINLTTNEVEPKRIVDVILTKFVSELVLVTFNTGVTIACTPDHRFMKNDRSFVEIQHVQDYKDLRSIDGTTHIINIQSISCTCPVYDITVEDNHNFLLDSGVFVHNSKDTADCVAGAVWNCTMKNPVPNVSTTKAASAIASVNGFRGAASRNSSFPGMPNLNIYNNKNPRRR